MASARYFSALYTGINTVTIGLDSIICEVCVFL